MFANLFYIFSFVYLGSGECTSADCSLKGELNYPFVEQDERAFLSPSEIYYPESWLQDNNRNTIEKSVMEELEVAPGVYMLKEGMPDSLTPFRVFRPDIKKRQ